MPVAATTVRYVRNARQIAKLLAIALPRQRNRLRAKVSEINGWTADSAFPKYAKGKGWPALEVIKWAQMAAPKLAEAKVKRNAISEALGSEKPSKTVIRQLSVVSGPLAEGGAAGDVYRPCESIRQLAPRLSAHFSAHVTEQRIKQWLDGQLPPGVTEPFPLRDPGRNGWNNPRPCFEWVAKNWLKPSNAAALQDDLFARTTEEARMAEMRRIIDDARRAKEMADSAERENSEKWIERHVAMNTAAAAIDAILNIVKKEYEKDAVKIRVQQVQDLISKLQGIDAGQWSVVSGQLVAEFGAWDAEQERARVDRIRKECGDLSVVSGPLSVGGAGEKKA